MSDGDLPASVRTEGAHLVTWAADAAGRAEADGTPYAPGTLGAEALRLRETLAEALAQRCWSEDPTNVLPEGRDVSADESDLPAPLDHVKARMTRRPVDEWTVQRSDPLAQIRVAGADYGDSLTIHCSGCSFVREWTWRDEAPSLADLVAVVRAEHKPHPPDAP